MFESSPECIITEVSEVVEEKMISRSIAKEFTPIITEMGDEDLLVSGQSTTNDKNFIGFGITNSPPGDHGDVPPINIPNLLGSNCPNSPLLAGFGLDAAFLQNSKNSPLPTGMQLRFPRTLPRRLSTLLDKVDSMDESQLRSSLNESVKENALLLDEVALKDKTIRRLTESLNDMNDFSQTHYQSFKTDKLLTPSAARIVSSDDITSDQDESCWESGYGIQSFSHHGNQIEIYSTEITETGLHNAKQSKSSLFEELGEALRDSRPMLEHNVINGTYIAKDVLVGGSMGWLAAYLLKKFGTTVLTAVSGGFLVIHFASRKGYVAVNWGEIYKEIEKKSEDNTPVQSEMDWITEKVDDFKKWIELHKYVAGGFIVSAAYNIFK